TTTGFVFTLPAIDDDVRPARSSASNTRTCTATANRTLSAIAPTPSPGLGQYREDARLALPAAFVIPVTTVVTHSSTVKRGIGRWESLGSGSRSSASRISACSAARGAFTTT